MSAKAHHIMIGRDSWCNWTGCVAGQRIQAQASAESGIAPFDLMCGHDTRAGAERVAKALRPHYRRGRVRVVPGNCPESLALLISQG